MKNLPTLLLIGGGGHCRSCIDVIEAEGKYKITGIIEQTGGNSESVSGYQILGNDNDLSELVKEYFTALITVGQIKSTDLRVKLFQQLRSLGFELKTIISSYLCFKKYQFGFWNYCYA
jgi:hypothetical protein